MIPSLKISYPGKGGHAGSKKFTGKNRLFWWILAGFVLLVGYVWMKVQINLQLAEVQRLEALKRRYVMEQHRLEAEKIGLDNIGRIQKLAKEELGMVFLPDEKIIKISKK